MPPLHGSEDSLEQIVAYQYLLINCGVLGLTMTTLENAPLPPPGNGWDASTALATHHATTHRQPKTNRIVFVCCESGCLICVLVMFADCRK